MLMSAHSPASPIPSERTLSEVRLGTSAFLSRKDTLFCPLGLIPVLVKSNIGIREIFYPYKIRTTGSAADQQYSPPYLGASGKKTRERQAYRPISLLS